jgi:hypothetical protein
LLESRDEQSYLAYLLAVFQYLNKHILREDERGSADHLDAKNFFSRCVDEESGFWSLIEEHINQIKKLGSSQEYLRSQISEECIQVCDKISKNSGVKVIFAFDEAMKLTRESNDPKNEIAFYNLRRALRSLPDNSSAFAIFTDTSSRTSVLCPAARVDPSLRARTQGVQLFDPFYFTQMDLARPLKTADPSFEQDLTVAEIASVDRLASYGRVLWYSTMKAGKDIDRANIKATEFRVMQLAIRKIIGGTKLESLVNDRNNSAAHFAILCSRLCVDVELNAMFTERLVSGYMAVLGFVSPARDSVIARFASEPILAEAAAHCMWYLKPSVVIRSYYEVLKFLPAGETGELVARILLLLSFDLLTEFEAFPASQASKPPLQHQISVGDLNQGIYFTKVRTVDAFIRSLIGADNFEQLDGVEWMKDTFLCFNHFNRVYHDITPGFIEECLKACMAIVCQANEYGVDLVIPMHHGGGAVSKDGLDAIFIQVKNRNSYFNPTDARNKLVGSYKRVFGTERDCSRTLFILMNVSDEGLSKGSFFESGTLFLDGLGLFPLLQGRPDLEDVLKQLVAHNLHLPAKFDPEDQRLIGSMYPRTY